MPPAPCFEGARRVDLAIVGGGYTAAAGLLSEFDVSRTPVQRRDPQADERGGRRLRPRSMDILTGVSGQIPLPAEFYRSLIFKPFMGLMTPV